MDNLNKPAWLTRMENGGIAEARTKAFLMDRFWILERSVDVHGADFIIQQRLTSRNILDENPPRLGVVQVKFYQDEKTTQYVHKDYVLDRYGEPRKEFFVMIHTGIGDNARKFLISAKDINKVFSIVEAGKTNADHFYIPGKVILNGSRFEVKLTEIALNQIDTALALADFKQNRYFLSWILPSAEISSDCIESDYKIDLDNSWGDIPQGIYELKKNIQSLLYDIAEVTSPLNEALKETDPEKMLNILEDLYHSFHGQIRFFHKKYYDEDLHYTVIEHKKMIEHLKTAGLLDEYLVLFYAFDSYVSNDLASKMKLDTTNAYILTVFYDSITLKNVHFSSQVIDRDNININGASGILTSQPGKVETFFVPGLYGYGKWGVSEQEQNINWYSEIKNKIWILRRPIMEEIYNHRFG